MVFGQLFQSGPDTGLTVGELCAILKRIHQLCVSAGAKSPAKDLKTFSEILIPHADKSVNAFCRDVTSRLNKAAEKPNTRKKASVASKSIVPNEDAVRRHVGQLRDAGVDRRAFETAISKLKADKSVKSLDVAEIARQYSDTITKYKSIAAAQADIEKAFVRQARFENKLR